MDHLWPADWLRDGDQEVRHLSSLRMEALEEDAPGVTDPDGPLSMIRLHEPCEPELRQAKQWPQGTQRAQALLVRDGRRIVQGPLLRCYAARSDTAKLRRGSASPS